MAITPKQELRQGQALVMTPQLQQSIKLLQLSNLELAAYLEQEIAGNPLLERVDAEQEEAEPADAEDGGEDGEDDEAAEAMAEDGGGDAGPQALLLDGDFDNVYTNDSPLDAAPTVAGGARDGYIGGRGGAIEFDQPGPDLEQSLPSGVTRREHLISQLNEDVHDPVDRLIGVHLIDLVDEAGYLAGDLASVAEAMGCGVARVEATLGLLQRFDPPGIFARSLSECLALQLAERDRLDPAMRRLLDHLDLLAKGDMGGLMRVCGVDAEDLAQMTAEIKALNPKPGLAFGDDVVQTLVPDVLVHQRADGSWRVELNNETLPKVLIDRRYEAVISGRAKSRADSAYISERLSSANWLIKSLDQRADTILRVASEIVRQQTGFLARGIAHLRPLTLKDVADAVALHESTVSRVTSNKWMATPRGSFELKYFFTTAIAASDGGASHSAEAVRHRIKALIEAETADDVRSDDAIVALLAADGVDIARRTVAKYREAMRIPSSARRRRLMKQAL